MSKKSVKPFLRCESYPFLPYGGVLGIMYLTWSETAGVLVSPVDNGRHLLKGIQQSIEC
jgi:hypothetical protein